MSQQSVRQTARRSAVDVQAVLRKERAHRERRLEGLAVEVRTALGERDQGVWDAECGLGRRYGQCPTRTACRCPRRSSRAAAACWPNPRRLPRRAALSGGPVSRKVSASMLE